MCDNWVRQKFLVAVAKLAHYAASVAAVSKVPQNLMSTVDFPFGDVETKVAHLFDVASEHVAQPRDDGLGLRHGELVVHDALRTHMLHAVNERFAALEFERVLLGFLDFNDVHNNRILHRKAVAHVE